MEEKKELLDQDERVVEIELERLRGFVNHPFKVRADSQRSVWRVEASIPMIQREKRHLLIWH